VPCLGQDAGTAALRGTARPGTARPAVPHRAVLGRPFGHL